MERYLPIALAKTIAFLQGTVVICCFMSLRSALKLSTAVIDAHDSEFRDASGSAHRHATTTVFQVCPL